MNPQDGLEEVVDKGFFSKLAKNKIVRDFVIPVFTASSLFFGCGKDTGNTWTTETESGSQQNSAPQTWVEKTDRVADVTDGGQRIYNLPYSGQFGKFILFWGTDNGGRVDRFEAKVEQRYSKKIIVNWTDPVKDSRIISPLRPGFYDLSIRSVDNEGMVDPTPAKVSLDIVYRPSTTPIFPLPSDDGLQFKINTSRTNELGNTIFTEAGNPEPVEVDVINNENLKIRNFDLVYFDGDKSEPILGFDVTENYLPSLNFSSHNSKRTLITDKIENGVVKLQVIENPEDFRAMLRFENSIFNKWAEYIYEETISKEENLRRYEKNFAYVKVADQLVFQDAGSIPRAIVGFFGVRLPSPMEALAPHLDPNGKVLNHERLDVYRVKRGVNSKLPTLVPDYIEIVPSNIPEVRIDQPRLDNNSLIFSWVGTDGKYYEKPFPEVWDSENIQARRDLTVLLGRTLDSDLDFEYVLYKNSVPVTHGSTLENGFTFSDLSEGKFLLRVAVTDEVGNQSLSSREFSLQRAPESTGSDESSGIDLGKIKVPQKFHDASVDTVAYFDGSFKFGYDYDFYDLENSSKGVVVYYDRYTYGGDSRKFGALVVYGFSNSAAAKAEHARAIQKGSIRPEGISVGLTKVTREQSGLLNSHEGYWYFDADMNPDIFGIVFRKDKNCYEFIYDGIYEFWTENQALDKGKPYVEQVIKDN